MLYVVFGGDMICLVEKANIGKMPDLLWNSMYWEFKRSTTLNAVDTRIRRAQEQLQAASKRDNVDIGGMVIDISRADITDNQMIDEIVISINSRCNKKQDVIISKNGKIIKVLRYR